MSCTYCTLFVHCAKGNFLCWPDYPFPHLFVPGVSAACARVFVCASACVCVRVCAAAEKMASDVIAQTGHGYA